MPGNGFKGLGYLKQYDYESRRHRKNFQRDGKQTGNSIHLPFEKHARVGRKYNGEYIYSNKLICKYTPEQVLQQLQEIADEKEVDITNSEVLIEWGEEIRRL